MNFALEIAITARLDIQQTTRWLLANRSPTVANRSLADLLESIHKLVDQPFRHPIADENENFPEEIRQSLHGKGHNKYRIIFTINNTAPRIFFQG